MRKQAANQQNEEDWHRRSEMDVMSVFAVEAAVDVVVAEVVAAARTGSHLQLLQVWRQGEGWMARCSGRDSCQEGRGVEPY